MDQDGPLACCGDLKLANQPRTLHVARRTFVIVIEADFAACDHLGLGKQRVELGQGAVIGLGGVVGIDSGAGE